MAKRIKLKYLVVYRGEGLIIGVEGKLFVISDQLLNAKF
jgi:hypothetical protein